VEGPNVFNVPFGQPELRRFAQLNSPLCSIYLALSIVFISIDLTGLPRTNGDYPLIKLPIKLSYTHVYTVQKHSQYKTNIMRHFIKLR